MRLSGGLIVAVALISPASADWQYAKWGMTAKQIIAASKGEAKAGNASGWGCAFKGYQPIAHVPHKTLAGFDFVVVFCSNSGGKLTSVVLNAGPGSYPEMRRAMLSRYGKPASDKGGDFGQTVWNEPKAGNSVLLRAK